MMKHSKHESAIQAVSCTWYLDQHAYPDHSLLQWQYQFILLMLCGYTNQSLHADLWGVAICFGPLKSGLNSAEKLTSTKSQFVMLHPQKYECT